MFAIVLNTGQRNHNISNVHKGLDVTHVVSLFYIRETYLSFFFSLWNALMHKLLMKYQSPQALIFDAFGRLKGKKYVHRQYRYTVTTLWHVTPFICTQFNAHFINFKLDQIVYITINSYYNELLLLLLRLRTIIRYLIPCDHH